MRFNAKKCYILTISDKGNSKFYELNDCILRNVDNNPYFRGVNFPDPPPHFPVKKYKKTSPNLKKGKKNKRKGKETANGKEIT